MTIKPMNKALAGIVLIALLMLGASFILDKESDVTGSFIDEDILGRSSVTLNITGEDFKFIIDGQDNPDINVRQGDKVMIYLSSKEGFHDFVVDEFNAATDRVSQGESTYVEFVADKKGTFEYYCSVGSHRENGMKGNLIVE